jgi:hypothetical protein
MPTKLTVIDGQRSSKPTRKLGRHGSTLWRNIIDEFEIDDAGGLEMLSLACQQLDRAESCRARIDADGDDQGQEWTA